MKCPSPRPNDSLAPAGSAHGAFTFGEFLSSLPKLLKSPVGERENRQAGSWVQCAKFAWENLTRSNAKGFAGCYNSCE